MVAANFRCTHSPSQLASSEGWRPPSAQSTLLLLLFLLSSCPVTIFSASQIQHVQRESSDVGNLERNYSKTSSGPKIRQMHPKFLTLKTPHKQHLHSNLPHLSGSSPEPSVLSCAALPLSIHRCCKLPTESQRAPLSVKFMGCPAFS